MYGNRADFPADEESAGYRGWHVAFASSIGVFVSFASVLVYTFGIFLKPLSQEFGWSRQAISAAFGIAAMTVAVCSPVLGRLLDRYGPRRIILPCLTVFGCAFASLALLTPNIAHLYAVFIVLGIVGNGTAQLAYSRAVSTWFVRRRGLALAVMMAGGATGAIILPPIAQALIQQAGWRSTFVLLGAMILVLGLPVVGLFIRERGRREGWATAALEGATVSEGLRSRAFWLIVVVLFIASISQNAAITHLSALLTDRGVDPGRAAMALSTMGIGSLIGRLLTGYLLDRFFGPHVSLALLGISAAGVYVLSVANDFATGCVAAALIGAGMGGEADVTPYLLSRYLGLRSFATLYGLTWTAYAIAGALGPMLMGFVFDATGSYRAFLTIVAMLTAGAAITNMAMPRYGGSARTNSAKLSPAGCRLGGGAGLDDELSE
jgi:predicted MFS family arabinose efflux permease